MNLRNNKVDKRRLKAEDRNFDTSRRERALSMAQQRRGALAYETNRPKQTTKRTPGSGGFTLGETGRGRGTLVQQERLRDEGQQARRAKGLRPEKFSSPEDPI